MIVRNAVTALTTIVVALVVALSVPISQLQTVTVQKSCCCPDPNRCHCPDEKPVDSKVATMRACHRTEQHMASRRLQTFALPEVATVMAPVRQARAPQTPLFTPHTPPAAAPPYGPS